MPFVVGIDEAGFGPLLGPLVVTGVLLECPEPLLGRSMWDTLRQSITAQICRNDSRLPVLDSKKLYTSGGGIKALERTTLVMMAAGGLRPRTFRELLALVAPAAQPALSDYPWYRDFDVDLPVHTTPADIVTRANAVRLDMEAHGVRLRKVQVEPLCEGHFNRLLQATRNKATALVSQTLRILYGACREAGTERLRAIIDRQGGRTHYGPSLLTSFAGSDLTIVEESATTSRYELIESYPATDSPNSQPLSARRMLEFRIGGESHHMGTALASVISKYIRELFMLALNGYWSTQRPGLSHTAGYYGDGQRFIRDIELDIARIGIDRSLLVRMR